MITVNRGSYTNYKLDLKMVTDDKFGVFHSMKILGKNKIGYFSIIAKESDSWSVSYFEENHFKKISSVKLNFESNIYWAKSGSYLILFHPKLNDIRFIVHDLSAWKNVKYHKISPLLLEKIKFLQPSAVSYKLQPTGLLIDVNNLYFTLLPYKLILQKNELNEDVAIITSDISEFRDYLKPRKTHQSSCGFTKDVIVCSFSVKDSADPNSAVKIVRAHYDRRFKVISRRGVKTFLKGHSYKIEEDVNHLMTIKNFQIIDYEKNEIVQLRYNYMKYKNKKSPLTSSDILEVIQLTGSKGITIHKESSPISIRLDLKLKYSPYSGKEEIIKQEDWVEKQSKIPETNSSGWRKFAYEDYDFLMAVCIFLVALVGCFLVVYLLIFSKVQVVTQDKIDQLEIDRMSAFDYQSMVQESRAMSITKPIQKPISHYERTRVQTQKQSKDSSPQESQITSKKPTFVESILSEDETEIQSKDYTIDTGNDTFSVYTGYMDNQDSIYIPIAHLKH